MIYLKKKKPQNRLYMAQVLTEFLLRTRRTKADEIDLLVQYDERRPLHPRDYPAVRLWWD